MLRAIGSRFGAVVSTAIRSNASKSVAATQVRYSHDEKPNPEEFDARTVAFLERADIDGWEVRQTLNDLQGEDMVPEPKIVIAALHACRRVNDFALTVRYLEAVKEKCGGNVDKIWPFMMKEIQPTLVELGIPSLEEIGYDKPELAAEDVYDMH